MTQRTDHLIRTALVVLVFFACGAAWIWAPLDDVMRGRIEGVLGLAALALIDVVRVFRAQLSGGGQ